MKCLFHGILLLAAVLSACGLLAAPAAGPTELFLRGYSVVPSPRDVRLSGGDVALSSGWSYRAEVPANHVAVRSLLQDLKSFHGLELGPAGAAIQKVVRLAVIPGSVKTGSDPAIAQQAYRLAIAPTGIEIVGNADQGLFYGVQTLVQLLKPGDSGNLVLPAGTIEDWPSLELRFLHWDTKHHQDRMETLKRYLDWSARFKINMIGFELEDKFSYPSHPVIGAPGAFTPAELQEIVDYGLERFIQVVPQIQSPAHLAYVLKYPEFAHLRSDGSNYQACLCDERTYDLIFSMYDDVIKATRGVQYFHVSTDEVYYAGICAKCSRPYNPENRSLAWVDFARRAHEFLSKRGRRMLAWVEYPVLPKHIRLLPPDLINAVMSGDPKQTREEVALGMNQLIYTSMQGEELLFPNNFAYESRGRLVTGHLAETCETLGRMSSLGRPLGTYGAAWDDSGLHGETFWLGWSTVAQYGWRPAGVSVDQHAADFGNVFYGPAVGAVSGLYRAMQSQARFFEESWDEIPSRVRPRAYGNSEGKGVGGERFDLTLPAPAFPSLPQLDFQPVYSEGRYADLAERARLMALESDALVGSLHEALLRPNRNPYNLEVFLTLARLMRHQARMIVGLKTLEEGLARAREASKRTDQAAALQSLNGVLATARAISQERVAVFSELQRVWEKSRFEKGREVGGKKFYHVMDDVKDHWADRRPDLTYMIAPEESIGLDAWVVKLDELARAYAKAHKLAEPSE